MNIDDYLNDNSALSQHLSAIYKEQLRLINENAELRKKLQEWSKDKEIQKAEDKVRDVRRRSLLVLSDIEMDELVKFRESHRQSCKNLCHYEYDIDAVMFGSIIKVKCPACGEQEDITDTSIW